MEVGEFSDRLLVGSSRTEANWWFQIPGPTGLESRKRLAEDCLAVLAGWQPKYSAAPSGAAAHSAH